MLSKNNAKDTLKTLFSDLCQDEDTENLTDKTRLIQQFQHDLEHLDNELENKIHTNIASSIFSGFSVCLAISGASLLASPLVAAVVLAASVSSAATIIGGSAHDHNEISKSLPKLKLYSLALSSAPAKHWGKVWHLVGDSLFSDALVHAAKGEIVDHKLIRRDKKAVLDAVLDYCSDRLGIKRDELVAQAQALTPDTAPTKLQAQPQIVTPALTASTAPTVIQDSAPTVLQSPTPTQPTNDIWLKSFLSSTCLVWGNQGSGKSWFVRLLAMRKKEAGYKVIVFDPNSNKSEWKGVDLYNTYEEIEEKMRWYVDEVDARYRKFGKSDMAEAEWRKQLWDNGQAITVICEEMTTYADFISDKELLTKFVKVAATLSRKQELPCIFVTHNNTQSCLGEIKGLANLISRMQQIQLLPKTDPITYQPVASGEALIKLDGSEQWTKVLTPKITEKITNFGEKQPVLADNESLDSEEVSIVQDMTTRQRLEMSFKLPDASTPAHLEVSPIASTILDIIRNGNPPTKLETIRKSRKWGDKTPPLAEIKSGIDELIQKELIDGDNENCFTIAG